MRISSYIIADKCSDNLADRCFGEIHRYRKETESVRKHLRRWVLND